MGFHPLGAVLLLSISTIMAENSQLQAVVRGNEQFSNRLYQIISKKDGNVFFSPISAHAVLAMAYQGSKGRTHEAFSNSLGFANASQAADGYHGVIGHLNNVADIQLLIANKMYVMAGYSLRPTFKEVTEKKFASEVESLDFGDSQRSSEIINQWVEEKTQNKIKDLIMPGSLTGDTRLVLVNAIYFKGNWAKKFDKKATKTEKFYVTENETIDVQMMNIKGDYLYKKDNELAAEILELSYSNPNISLIILLPIQKNGIAELEKKLANIDLSKLSDELYAPEVIVKLPKFKIETTIDLNQPLKKLGLDIIFGGDANFSGILDSEEHIGVSQIIQKAFIEINEEGTEAAAATAIIYGLGSARVRPEPEEFLADHPFIIYLSIKNPNRSRLSLFAGRISNP